MPGASVFRRQLTNEVDREKNGCRAVGSGYLLVKLSMKKKKDERKI